MSDVIKIQAPISEETARKLRAGDVVELSGAIYSARDSAHKRIIQMLDAGEALPFELEDAVIYYMGPAPAPPGKVIGSAGPTTSGRMDAYSPRLIEKGLRGMIGKGNRSKEVVDACVTHGSVYFAAIGGAGALMAQSIKSAEVVAFEDMGPEAVRRLLVEDMPLVVINDTLGQDLYQQGREKYKTG